MQHKAFSTAARIPVVRLPARLTRISCPLAVSSFALQRRAWACRRGRHRGDRRRNPGQSGGSGPTGPRPDHGYAGTGARVLAGEGEAQPRPDLVTVTNCNLASFAPWLTNYPKYIHNAPWSTGGSPSCKLGRYVAPFSGRLGTLSGTACPFSFFMSGKITDNGNAVSYFTSLTSMNETKLILCSLVICVRKKLQYSSQFLATTFKI